jgi:hypothetical protein
MVKISKKGSKSNIRDIKDKVLLNSSTTSHQIPSPKEENINSKAEFKLT